MVTGSKRRESTREFSGFITLLLRFFELGNLLYLG
jgi:hypothetical protein